MLLEISVEIYASPSPQNPISICGADFFHILIKSTIFGNKTTSVVFKQHDPQSVVDLSGVAEALILGVYGTQTRKNDRFFALLDPK